VRNYFICVALFASPFLQSTDTKQLYEYAFELAKNCYVRPLVYLINNNNLDLSHPCDEQGNTLTHYAMGCKDPQAIKKMLDSFAQHATFNANIKNNQDVTPLHTAAMGNNHFAIREILKKGASPHALDASASNAISYALPHCSPYSLVAFKQGGDRYSEDPQKDYVDTVSNATLCHGLVKNMLSSMNSPELFGPYENLLQEKEIEHEAERNIIQNELNDENMSTVDIVLDYNTPTLRAHSVYKQIGYNPNFLKLLNDQEKQAAIRHEIEHIKRNDSYNEILKVKEFMEKCKDNDVCFNEGMTSYARLQENLADMAAIKKYPQGFLMLCANLAQYNNDTGEIHDSWEERALFAQEYIKILENEKLKESSKTNWLSSLRTFVKK